MLEVTATDTGGLSAATQLAVSYAATGDTNIDGLVDMLDVASFLGDGKFDTGWSSGWSDGDFNGDAFVDILDVAAHLASGFFDAGPVTAAMMGRG